MNRTYSLKANSPSKMDYTVFIPEEIWIKIASYLSQQELCRKASLFLFSSQEAIGNYFYGELNTTQLFYDKQYSDFLDKYYSVA